MTSILNGLVSQTVKTVSNSAKNTVKDIDPAMLEKIGNYLNKSQDIQDYSNRIARAQAELKGIGNISRFSKDPKDIAKRQRIVELNDNIKAWRKGFEDYDSYISNL